MRLHTTLVLTTAILLAAPALAGTYVGGGTFVAKTELGTLLDNGGVVCHGTDGDGVGGGCLLFPSASREGGFVRVVDGAAGLHVAFQVCIDNNGDGVCGGPLQQGDCNDQIFFSHDDNGTFFNPLGPLPTRRIGGCDPDGTGFDGYVVLLCQGAHEVDGTAHAHPLTQGSIGLAPSGSGYGDFCGGGFGSAGGFVNAAAKAYTIV